MVTTPLDNKHHEPSACMFQDSCQRICLNWCVISKTQGLQLQVKMQPKEVLFRVGDDSQSGIFIVVEGRLGVYLEENDSDSLTLTNTLITGESVGDLDVLDGAHSSM